MSNKQQTAVDWLVEQLKSRYDIDIERLSVTDKAKEMEKEQHLKWNKFLETEKTLGISDVKTIERIQWYYNQYYNETYNN
jgi:hypothetical protein